MKESDSYINYLKLEQPLVWNSIKKAADDGLIIIDEANDAVTATNRLMLTYPGLHDVLNMLVEGWHRGKTDERSISDLLKYLNSDCDV